MKNIFFVIAFMLIATLTFANSNENSANVLLNDLKTTIVFGNLTTVDYSLQFDEIQPEEIPVFITELSMEKSCHIRGTIIITSPNGSVTSYDIDITIEGQSCAELLKSLM